MRLNERERQFPVLWPYDRDGLARLNSLGCPRAVPWSLVAPHEKQAQRNHSQSLDQLAYRGGLSPGELVAVLEGRPWHRMLDADAVRVIGERLAALLATEVGR